MTFRVAETEDFVRHVESNSQFKQAFKSWTSEDKFEAVLRCFDLNPSYGPTVGLKRVRIA